MHFKRTTLFLSLAAAAGCTNAVDTNSSLEPVTTQHHRRAVGQQLARAAERPRQSQGRGSCRLPTSSRPSCIETPVAQGSIRAREPPDGDARRRHHRDGRLLRLRRRRPHASGRGRPAERDPQRRGEQDRARQEHLPGALRPDRRRCGLRLRHALPVPGPRARQRPATSRRINLDADGAHRVTLMAATDVTGAPLADIDGSTWDPFAQRLIFTTESAGAPDVPGDARPSRRSSRTSRARSGAAATKASRTTPTATSGSSRTSAAPSRRPPRTPRCRTASSTASCRSTRTASRRASCRSCRSPRSARASRSPSRATDAVTADIGDLHTYGNSFATAWVTIHDTDVDGTAPFDANAARQGQARHAVQAARERPVPPGLEVQGVLLRRDRRHRLAHRGGRGVRRLRPRVQAEPEESVGQHRHADPLLPRRHRRTAASTTARS